MARESAICAAVLLARDAFTAYRSRPGNAASLRWSPTDMSGVYRTNGCERPADRRRTERV